MSYRWECPDCGNINMFLQTKCEACEYEPTPVSELIKDNGRLSKSQIRTRLGLMQGFMSQFTHFLRELQTAEVYFNGSIIIDGTRCRIDNRSLVEFEYDNVAQEYTDIKSKGE